MSCSGKFQVLTISQLSILFTGAYYYMYSRCAPFLFKNVQDPEVTARASGAELKSKLESFV